MNWAADQIRKQEAKMERQRLMWQSLGALADLEKYGEFWSIYAAHLEQTARETCCMSDERKLLVKVMKATANRIGEPNGEE